MLDKIRSWSVPQIFWSAAIAIGLWSAIGFNWFGPGFNWSTESTSMKTADIAVTDRLASICVAQAQADPMVADGMKKLTDMTSWKRKKFIDEAKWSVMPGSDSSESGVPELCAQKLLST